MKQNIVEKINKMYNEAREIEDPVKYTKELVKILRMMHPSDAHKAIEEVIKPNTDFKIKQCKKVDVKTYQELQDMILIARKSADHDKQPATNLDVDMVATRIYSILCNMIRVEMDTQNERFTKVTTAINKIEERLGMDATDFREDDENDSADNENEQRVEETTNRSGNVGKSK